MNIELNTTELALILMHTEGKIPNDLWESLEAVYQDQVELDDMDFDDCAGGACKL